MKILAALLVCTIIVVSSGASLRTRRWSRNQHEYAVAPGFRTLALDDSTRQKMTETFSDSIQGLTVLKDPSENVRACFITDLDREFSLTTLEKLEILDSQEPFKVTSAKKNSELMNKAGPMISTMCRRLSIFWLNEQVVAPLPLLKIVKGPPSLNLNTPPKPLGPQPSHIKTPPSHIKTPPSIIKTPPPLPMFNNNEMKEVVMAPEVHMKVPPRQNLGMRMPPPLMNSADRDEVESVKVPMMIPPRVGHHMEAPRLRVPPQISEKSFRAPPPLRQVQMRAPPPL